MKQEEGYTGWMYLFKALENFFQCDRKFKTPAMMVRTVPDHTYRSMR